MADTKVFLPAQKTRHGVAGYRGDNLVVVDSDGKEVKKATTAASKAAAARKKETASSDSGDGE